MGNPSILTTGGGPRLVASTAAYRARVRGSLPGLGGLKETKMFLPHPLSIMRSLCDQGVACSASDRHGSNFESCVWRAVSSYSSHHPQEVRLARLSLYVHITCLKPHPFHFISILTTSCTWDETNQTTVILGLKRGKSVNLAYLLWLNYLFLLSVWGFVKS